MTVEIEDKGGNCGSIGMGNGTWFTILDIPGWKTFLIPGKPMTRLTAHALKHESSLT